MLKSMTKNGEILVTGGAGYIGSHAVLALQDAGYQVVVLDDLSTGYAELLPPGVKFVQGDVADISLLNRLFAEHQISAIMHFAAKLIVPESVSNPGLYYHNNVGKFTVLLNCAVAVGIKRFIFSSTAAVYGQPGHNPITEKVPPSPINPYGASKLMAEQVLGDVAAAHGLQTVVLRYFNVAGADPDGRAGQMTKHATHLIKVAVETAVGKRPGMQIFGTDYSTPDGTCLRDYIHVSDLADAHVKALEYLAQGGENITLNCGYGRGFSVRDVIDKVAKVSGQIINTDIAPRRAGDPAALIADSTQIRNILGWRPQYDNLHDIVKTALAWEDKQIS
jgi:UDP-glucose 4-epimerase